MGGACTSEIDHQPCLLNNIFWPKVRCIFIVGPSSVTIKNQGLISCLIPIPILLKDKSQIRLGMLILQSNQGLLLLGLTGLHCCLSIMAIILLLKLYKILLPYLTFNFVQNDHCHRAQMDMCAFVASWL